MKLAGEITVVVKLNTVSKEDCWKDFIHLCLFFNFAWKQHTMTRQRISMRVAMSPAQAM